MTFAVKSVMRLFLGTCLALCSFSLQAAEARFVAVTKGLIWTQDSTAAPKEKGGNYFQFRAYVEMARADALTSATLKLPNPPGTTRNLTEKTLVWESLENYSTRNAMNSAAPNGIYTFVVQSAVDGRKTNSVNLTSDTFPIPIRVANFVEAQAIDSKADFTLRWDPAGSGALGFVQVRIFNGDLIVFQSPTYPQAAAALNGSASSISIPRNTLAEGAVYRGEITIWRKVTDDLTGYPGVAAWAAYTQTTEFPIHTQFAVTDVVWYGFTKVQRFLQTSANPPFPSPTNQFSLIGFTDATASPNITAASISGASGNLPLVNASGSWRATDNLSTQQALDTRYPAGALTLSIQTLHNGVRNLSLTLPSGPYPTAPQFSNFHEANRIEAAQPFALKWNAPADGATADFVEVILRKNGAVGLRSGLHPAAPGALNGTTTSFNLPANFLSPGEACEASILFLKAATTDTFSYPKATGLAGYASQTTAIIRARGGNVTTPILRNPRSIGGMVQFDFAADSGRQYLIQGTSDFSRWTDLLTTNAPGSNFALKVNIDSGRHHQILRVLAN